MTKHNDKYEDDIYMDEDLDIEQPRSGWRVILFVIALAAILGAVFLGLNNPRY